VHQLDADRIDYSSQLGTAEPHNAIVLTKLILSLLDRLVTPQIKMRVEKNNE
jgi:hypothetical protein